MVKANHFSGVSDSDILQKAVDERGEDGVVLIEARRQETEPERDFWLLDRAITLPSHTTVILDGCKIKLSDRCRDNFFRSANCGLGIAFPEQAEDIHIIGKGDCLLEGADRPRATGDSTKEIHAPCPHEPEEFCRVANWIPEDRRTPEKIGFWDIHNYSYGTDSKDPAESQYGDWRGIGILLARVKNFSISGLTIAKPHCWSISLEDCAYGRVEHIHFAATMYREIDGVKMNMENQDGVDLRNGCHHITISHITGQTGDDVIALTAIADEPFIPGGSLAHYHVMHNDWTQRERDIHDIEIRHVSAHSYLCYVVRLLPANTRIYNVTIDDVTDTATDPGAAFGTVILGDMGAYGENFTDSLQNISISNVVCNSKNAISVKGYLSRSEIKNVTNKNPACPAIFVRREGGLVDVAIDRISTPDATKEIGYYEKKAL